MEPPATDHSDLSFLAGGGEMAARMRALDWSATPLGSPETWPQSLRSIAVVCFEVTELAKARRDAETASRAKDEFLAMLGHELRNPLAPILTALQLMNLRGLNGAERERQIIERQLKHVVRLVDDLLACRGSRAGRCSCTPNASSSRR